MGACVNKIPESLSDVKKELKKPPEDTQLYNPKHNSQIRMLKFQGTLTNVRIEGNIEQPFGVSFQISDRLMQANFPICQPQGQQKKVIRWRIKQESFKFNANEYQIRKKMLEIKILRKDNQVFEFLKLNLYKVLTGPVKNSFKINIQDGKHIRLIYDLKVSEVLKIQARVKSAQLSFKKEHHGEKFNFTTEWILSQNGKNSRKIMTRPSSSLYVPQKKQNILEQLADDPEQPVTLEEPKLKKKSSNKQAEKYNTVLQWKIQQILPQITFNLTVEEVNTSLFWLHCWKISDNKDSNQKQVMHRFANFRITFNELLQISKQKFTKKSQQSLVHMVNLDQQLWSNGAVIGRCKAELQISLPEYIKQLHGCVRTQNGTLNSQIQPFQLIEQSVTLQPFQKLKNFHEKLLNIKTELTNRVENYMRRKQTYKETIKVIQQICKQLRGIGFSNEMISKDTKKMKQLLDKQFILLQLMNTGYTLLNEPDKGLSQQCWKLIILLIKRGQLQLKSIGFSDQQINQLNTLPKQQIFSQTNHSWNHKGKQKQHKLLKRKTQLALQFQKVLFGCLTQSLNSGPTYIDEYQGGIQVSQVFKGYCFIRIPIFRDQVLKQIHRPEDLEYNQFQIKERQWLKSRYQIKAKQGELFKQIQWDHYFYKPLESYSQSHDLNQQLQNTLQNSIWMEQIYKREAIFFQFFRIIMQKYIQIQAKYKIPKYKYFSGYNKLVAAFLNQMKSIPLKNYPNELIKSSMILLKNQDLHEPILSLIAKKTNYYETTQVLRCISIYRLYINILTQGNNLLPLSFCYGVFIKIIKKILLSQSVNCVSTILMLIYQTYDKFQSQFRSYLTFYLLGSMFNRLFYHWSYVVRSIFHHFFVLKIAQNKQIFQNLGSRIQTKLRISYEKVLQHLRMVHKQLLHTNSIKVIQKQENKSYYMKMKHKLWRRKQSSDMHSTQGSRVHKNTDDEDQKQYEVKKHNRKAFSAKQIDFFKELSQSRQGWPLVFDFDKKEEHINLYAKQTQQEDCQILVKSQTIFQEEDILPQISSLKSFQKQYTYHESAKYHGAFYEHQFSLSEFRQIQKNQIQISHLEFQKINSCIAQKFSQNQELPSLPQSTFGFDSNFIVPEQIEYFSF